jgi:hypothetical protein
MRFHLFPKDKGYPAIIVLKESSDKDLVMNDVPITPISGAVDIHGLCQ